MTKKASFVLLILTSILCNCKLRDTSGNQEVMHEEEVVNLKWPASVDVVKALVEKTLKKSISGGPY